MLRSAGARPLRKTLRRCPAGSRNSPEKYLVDLGRDTRTRTQPLGALIGLLERIR